MATGGAQYSESHLERMLECCVCTDILDDPLTLQHCLHTVCKSCMQQMKAAQDNHPPGVICPICKRFSGEDMITSNFFIKELTELHKSVKEQKKIICKQCYNFEKKTLEAICKCVDCKANLCESCKLGHQKIEALKGHQIVGLSDDNGELIIDENIKCPKHNDKHTELFCIPCQSPVCITCTVTTHHGHPCQTVDEALVDIVQKIEEGAGFIDENITQIATSVEDVDAKITETTLAFEKCLNGVDNLAEEQQKYIEERRIQIKHKLKTKKSEEISKLVNIKENLEMKKRERENLKDVVKISLKHAQHATLLNEVIQSGLQGKIQAVKDEEEHVEVLKVEHPQLDTCDTDWVRLIENILGEVLYYDVKLSVSSTHGITRFGSRYWDVNFKEYFQQKFNPKSVEIKGPVCSQVKLINGKIWTPTLSAEHLNIYNTIGKLTNTIKVAHSCSVAAADNGDIFIACRDNYGLHVITGDDLLQKVSDGSFCDVCSHRSKVYAMEHVKQVITEYVLDRNTNDLNLRWKPGKELKIEYAANPKFDYAKTFIVSGSDENIQFYVSLFNDHKIVLYNPEGKCVRTFKSEAYPRLCGIDNHSNLLVANLRDYVYRILDTSTGEQISTGVKGESCSYDAILDDANNLWLCHYNTNNEYIITKHVPQ